MRKTTIAVMMMLGMSLSTDATGDKTACMSFSVAIEFLADSQNRTADFVGEEKVSLMCIQHDESRRYMKRLRDFDATEVIADHCESCSP